MDLAKKDLATGKRNHKIAYNRFLLLVAGLGGFLYGVDVGIIAGALPYLEATTRLSAGQLSFVVATVLLGSVISTLFAGMLADWMGRRILMVSSGLLFVVSIPMIALSHGYGPLVFGRLLQGLSAGLIGVVVPLYLAECLGAANRGKGAGVFQWLLTAGLVMAAAVGMFFSIRVEQVAKLGDPIRLLAFKDNAWRSIFWVSLPPGIFFVVGSLLVSESPRWLLRHGKRAAAHSALLRSRSSEQTVSELRDMEIAIDSERKKNTSGIGARESLWRSKYLVPFVLACVILACNQATGVNSIIGYNTSILLQGGLGDIQAHWCYVIFTMVNFVMTIFGIMLVDRKGRKFLLSMGSAGLAVSLICTGVLFQRTEKWRVDARSAVQLMVGPHQNLTIGFNETHAKTLFAAAAGASQSSGRQAKSLTIIYSYGDFRAATKVARSDDESNQTVEINRQSCVPANRVLAFFSNPFGNLEQAQSAPLRVENALISPVPTARDGWMLAASLFAFASFYAIGPGVCVWLALSELMPTRIRSNGMSIALLINQAVSTTIAAIFLPTVGKYGYSTMFFCFAGCTVIYFITSALFLPETKGKTLEEIEAYFDRTRGNPGLVRL